MDFLRFAGDAWRKADQALGGWLPGGGVASPATKAVRWVAKPDPVGRAQEVVRSTAQRAVDPRYARDAVLNLPVVPEPERRFIQAMTGGVPGDKITELSPEFLSYIKHASDKKQHISNLIDLIDPEVLNKFGVNRAARNSNVSLYGYGRDIANSLGTIGVWKDAQGNVVIKDKWKVDDNSIGKPIKPGDVPARQEFYSDLGEGGAIASWLFNRARDAGTYRPIDYEIRVPAKEWEAITPSEGPERSDDALTQSRDYLYRYLSHLVAPNKAPVPERTYNNPYESELLLPTVKPIYESKPILPTVKPTN